MNIATYEELNDLLWTLKKERASLQKKIDENNLQIYEARSYALEILEKEEEDFKVFSPRKIEDIYKVELEESNVKQADYENRNRSLIAEIEKLDSIISVLEKVSEENIIGENIDQKSGEVSDEISQVIIDKTADETISQSIQTLTKLMRKIELSTKFIHQDPMRTKNELGSVNKGIKKVTDELSNIVAE